MKKGFHIFVVIFALITILVGALSFLIPFATPSVDGSSSHAPITVFDLSQSGTAAVLKTGEYASTFLFFIYFFVLLSPLLILFGQFKKGLNYWGYACGVVAFSFMFVLFFETQNGGTGSGHWLILVYLLQIALLIFFDAWRLWYFQSHRGSLFHREKSLAERFIELEELHDQKLISDEEYAKKREEYLNEK